MRRTRLANNAYYILLPIMKSKEVHKQKKIELCKTLIRSVLWYGSEAWTLSQTAEKVLNASERKALRKMYGPVLVNGQRHNRYNHEICKLYKETELTKNIRFSRLQWFGNVTGMKDERVFKIATKGYIKWCRNWRRSAEDGDARRRRIEDVKVQGEL